MAKRKTPRRAAPAREPHFTPELFSFLRALARHNDRAWFAANKDRYETHVKRPLLDFIADFAPRLATISRELVADPRPIGGSMFRIYRDTRFSKDKSPYKTHAAAHFPHRAAKAAKEESVHAPGYYLHLEPGRVFFAGGLWRPEPAIAQRIRLSIDANRAAWTRATSGRVFEARLELEGDSLVRPPRGFPQDHPLLEHLKRKDFIATASFDERLACSADFLDEVAAAAAALAPMMSFLTKAVGLSW